MFDLNSKDGSTTKTAYRSPIPDEPSPQPAKPQKLNSEKMQDLHKELLSIYLTEIDRQNANRAEMAEDENFYDNIQWSDEDAQVLRDRGQVPLVYNVISASVDWVTGTEKRARTDYRIFPRRKKDSKPAQRKTDLMKYLSDTNKTGFDISQAFEDAVKAGVGWVEDGVDYDTDGEPIYTRYETWRNIIWDSTARDRDLSDARYIFRTKWLDLDVAQALFRNRKHILEEATDNADSYYGFDQYGDDAMDERENDAFLSGNLRNDPISTYHRRRVRVIEAWYRIPSETKHIQGGSFKGEVFDEYSAAHKEAIASGESSINVRTTMRMHVVIFTTTGLLWFSPSPYRHNKFPFTPIWGYVRGRDGMPYGMIRRLKDIQQDINKRASKALYILSTNKVVMDKGAVDDIDELMEEVSRPDGLIVKNPGKELVINAERELAPAHLDQMSRGIAMVQQASGVTDELMGRRTNAISGIAIQSRQEQGSLVTAVFFDNLQYFGQCRGEKQLSLMEQFMSEEKMFRITNARGKAEYVNVNDGLPENDITRSKADFVIAEQDYQINMRQAAAKELMELIAKLPPEIGLTLLDLAIENMDIQNADEIVKRVRSITGQKDPDADEEQPTPEEQQRQQMQQMQAEIAQMQQKLQMALMEAEANKKNAEAQRAFAQAQQYGARAVSDNVGSQQQALSAATQAISIPQTIDVADMILRESGFVPRSEQERNQAIAEEQQKQAQQAAAEQQAQQQAMPEQPSQPQQQPAAEQPQQPDTGMETPQ